MDTIITVCPLCQQPITGHDPGTAAQHMQWYMAAAQHSQDISFSKKGIEGPSNVYISGVERLRFRCWNSVNGAQVSMLARILTPDGVVIPMQFDFAPNANRTVFSKEIDIQEGFLLDVTAAITSGVVRQGQTFVIIDLIRSAGANAQPLRSLIYGYPTSGNMIGWPDSVAVQATSGTGLTRSVQTANPGAGADIVTTVPTGARWLLQSMEAVLTTGVAAGNRVVHFVIKDAGGNQIFNVAASNNQLASLAVSWSVTGGVVPQLNDGAGLLPCPDLAWLFQGWTIGTVTTGLQGADQWSAIFTNVLELIEP